MLLIGRNLSPFARRVAVWCALQGREIERREISVAGQDFDEVRRLNPVGRVPALVLDDGTVLIETFAICDWLEETAPVGRRLMPVQGEARRECLQRLALANSVAEKAVAMVYERNRRPEALHWKEWQDRLAVQIRGGLEALEARVPAAGWSGGDWTGGGNPDGGDIAAIIAWQFLEVMNPWLLEPARPRLAALAARGMEVEAIAATRPEAA